MKQNVRTIWDRWLIAHRAAQAAAECEERAEEGCRETVTGLLKAMKIEYVECPDHACSNHFHAFSCIICEAPAVVMDYCGFIDAWLCESHFDACDLLDGLNPVTAYWEHFNKLSVKAIPGARNRS